MANLHSTHPWDAPYYEAVEQDAFGHYLAGLTDGEGSFDLRQIKGFIKSARFCIALRADDASILLACQKYLGCGNIHGKSASRTEGRNACPQCWWAISRAEDLAKVVVPLFHRYPLRAKKARDFLIWEQGVHLVYRVSQRRQRRNRGQRDGFMPRWKEEEKAEFDRLAELLRSTREFDSGIHPELHIRERQIVPTDRTLFD